MAVILEMNKYKQPHLAVIMNKVVREKNHFLTVQHGGRPIL